MVDNTLSLLQRRWNETQDPVDLEQLASYHERIGNSLCAAQLFGEAHKLNPLLEQSKEFVERSDFFRTDYLIINSRFSMFDKSLDILSSELGEFSFDITDLIEDANPHSPAFIGFGGYNIHFFYKTENSSSPTYHIKIFTEEGFEEERTSTMKSLLHCICDPYANKHYIYGIVHPSFRNSEELPDKKGFDHMPLHIGLEKAYFLEQETNNSSLLWTPRHKKEFTSLLPLDFPETNSLTPRTGFVYEDNKLFQFVHIHDDYGSSDPYMCGEFVNVEHQQEHYDTHVAKSFSHLLPEHSRFFLEEDPIVYMNNFLNAYDTKGNLMMIEIPRVLTRKLRERYDQLHPPSLGMGSRIKQFFTNFLS